MLNCTKCGFMVTKDMGFSVRQNKCPSCGSVLMTNDFLSDVKKVKTEISASRILVGFGVSEDAMNLLSILVKNKFMEKIEEKAVSLIDDVLEVPEDDNEDVDESVADNMEDIRRMVMQDAIAAADSFDDEGDFDSEIERKKSLARNNPFARKTGARVSRISGD